MASYQNMQMLPSPQGKLGYIAKKHVLRNLRNDFSWLTFEDKSALHTSNFWATVCKTVLYMLSNCCPVCRGSDVRVLWPNGWMDQDKTCHAGRPRPWPHCVRWGLSFPHRKGHSSPHFSVHVYCGQTVARLKYCWALVPYMVVNILNLNLKAKSTLKKSRNVKCMKWKDSINSYFDSHFFNIR